MSRSPSKDDTNQRTRLAAPGKSQRAPRFALVGASLAASIALAGCGASGSALGPGPGPARTLSGLPAAASAGSGNTLARNLATPDLASVPQWALAPAARDDMNEVGIGSGASLEEATRMALQDMASRISVSVESELRDIYSEADGRSASSVEQVVETKVLGTRFTGWERSRTAEVRGTYWVEVKIERARLIRDSRLELNQLSSQVSGQLAKPGGTALSRLMALQTTSIERERIRNLVTLLAGLDSTFERNRFDAMIRSWNEVDRDARRALVFEVSADPASREIARWLESRLAAERFKTRPGTCAAGDAVCIEIRSELVETDIAQRFVAKIRSRFAVLDPDGRTLNERDLVGRGDSSADANRARRKALREIRDQFGVGSLLDGLIEPVR